MKVRYTIVIDYHPELGDMAYVESKLEDALDLDPEFNHVILDKREILTDEGVPTGD